MALPHGTVGWSDVCDFFAFPGHLIFVSDKDKIFFEKCHQTTYTYVSDSLEVYLIKKHGKNVQ